MKNPWLKPAPERYPVDEIQSVSVDDRCMELKSFGQNKLRAVILWKETQKTVRLAAERRLRNLIKLDRKVGKDMKAKWIIGRRPPDQLYLTLSAGGKYIWDKKGEAILVTLNEGQKIRDLLAVETFIERI